MGLGSKPAQVFVGEEEGNLNYHQGYLYPQRIIFQKRKAVPKALILFLPGCQTLTLLSLQGWLGRKPLRSWFSGQL